MKLDRIKWRFCRAVNCARLKGLECEAEQCEHPDTEKALNDRRAELKAVKYG